MGWCYDVYIDVTQLQSAHPHLFVTVLRYMSVPNLIVDISCVFGSGREFQRWMAFIIRSGNFSWMMHVHALWCILSCTTVVAYIVHQGDVPAYYLHVIWLIQNILTHITDVMSVDELGKMSDIMWTAPRIVKNQSFCHSSVFVENSRKCI